MSENEIVFHSNENVFHNKQVEERKKKKRPSLDKEKSEHSTPFPKLLIWVKIKVLFVVCDPSMFFPSVLRKPMVFWELVFNLEAI